MWLVLTAVAAAADPGSAAACAPPGPAFPPFEQVVPFGVFGQVQLPVCPAVYNRVGSDAAAVRLQLAHGICQGTCTEWVKEAVLSTGARMMPLQVLPPRQRAKSAAGAAAARGAGPRAAALLQRLPGGAAWHARARVDEADQGD